LKKTTFPRIRDFSLEKAAPRNVKKRYTIEKHLDIPREGSAPTDRKKSPHHQTGRQPDCSSEVIGMPTDLKEPRGGEKEVHHLSQRKKKEP